MDRYYVFSLSSWHLICYEFDHNFSYWLAKLTMPLQVVFIVQSIQDTARSSFRTHFSQELEWSNKLENLANSPVTTNCEVLSFCGLEFQEKVLRFHHNKCTVLNASVAHVRRKSNTKSLHSYSLIADSLQSFNEHLIPFRINKWPLRMQNGVTDV